ncbi:MAG: M64 family metallopeptidase [Bacteroidota bacterium]
MEEIFKVAIDPAIAKEVLLDPEVQVFTSLDNGDPHVKADIAIIGEGYTAAEAEKFQNDLQRFTEVFFKAEPCRSNKDKFNIRGVLKPSEDSGISEPRAGITKNTSVGATFNSMGSERYVLTEANQALQDIAGHVPYDALYIMVNHSRYGGGGIYNLYCVYTTDNIFSEYLMVHEFGHSFFGLADEYYTSPTAYTDFYTVDKEPNEPNITSIADPEKIKWKHLLTLGIELPTTWNKAPYDSIDLEWQKVRAAINDSIAALQRNGASAEAVRGAKAYYDYRDSLRNTEVQSFLEGSPFAGQVGAFEGAGYMPSGLYRSSVNCIMFTKTDYFCPVCQEAMVKGIDSYSN